MADQENQGLREVTISLGGSWGDVTAKRDSDTGDFTLDLGGALVSVSPEDLAIAKVCVEEGKHQMAIELLTPP